MGVRTKTVKKSARVIVEKYYSRLGVDFHTNKRICDEVAVVPSKRMRNKIAGFVTHLMKRIARGPVRGISLKLQEEERERRTDFVPEVPAIDQDFVEVDPDTKDMLDALDFKDLPGLGCRTRFNFRVKFVSPGSPAASADGVPVEVPLRSRQCARRRPVSARKLLRCY